MGEENKNTENCYWVKSTEQFKSINVKAVWQIVLFQLFSRNLIVKSEAETVKSRDEKVYYSEKSTTKVYLVLWYSQIDESLNTIKSLKLWT